MDIKNLPRFDNHSHSEFSNLRLIDSINRAEDMILTAHKLGMKGIALTDHETVSGHVKWLNTEKELKKAGKIPEDFKCACGNEIYLVDDRNNIQRYWHFILIAKNTEGHRALRELSSIAWYNGFSSKGLMRVPTQKDELAEIVKKYPNTLIATSACLGGELPHLVAKLVDAEKKGLSEEEILNIKLEIVAFLRYCVSLFGDDFYIEIAAADSKDQKVFNKRIKSIAESQGIKIVIGSDAHYLTSNERELHKAYLNSKEGEREVDNFYYFAHMMDNEEAFGYISDIYSEEEFIGFCDNSMEIYDKIEGYDIFRNPIIPEVQVKNYTPFTCETDFTGRYNPEWDFPTIDYLLCSEEIQERYWINECLNALREKDLYNTKYLARIEIEARVIKTIGEKLGDCLFKYFNTFQHFIDLFWECGSLVGPGRGSAVCFLSNYLLGITQLDPVVWNLPYWRFLNEERVELPDIDIDLTPSKRKKVFEAIRKERGELNCVQVCTFGTEGTRSAIAAACRGYRSEEYPDGIEVETAQFLSGLIPMERGFLWSIHDVINGNEEKDRKPNETFIKEVGKYPGLLKIIQSIEGLICKRGQHASGVILYNNSPYDTNALMRSPNGDLTTQFDLHMSEQCGDVKYDFLVTEICDKITICIDMLQKEGFFEQDLGLRQVYDQYLHPAVLNLEDNRMWDALGEGTVMDVFQFSTGVGLATAKQIKPRDPVQLTSANALMRLMGEKGKERPMDRYCRLKSNMQLWYNEVKSRGLTEAEIKILEPYYLPNFGTPCSQEDLMEVCMDKNIAHFTLAEANMARKIVAKKQVKKVPELREKFISQCPNRTLGEYVWETVMEPQMSYAFAKPHALAYSFVGIQTLYLATNFPEVFWNCACLIVNAGGAELMDADDVDGDEDETEKKKNKSVNYGKISTAIGETQKKGISVLPPDINRSSLIFAPDLEQNSIVYGLKGITRIGTQLVYDIISKRPYTSISDFLSKIKVNKTQMIALIKSGAFDSLCGDRETAMNDYLDLIADKKKRITLQNMQKLIELDLIPEEYSFEVKVFNFNKYIKKFKEGSDYRLDAIAMRFFTANYNDDVLKNVVVNGEEQTALISQSTWDNTYKKAMDPVRDWMKKNQQEILDTLNAKLVELVAEKYTEGNISKWEMDSLGFYYHEHELQNLRGDLYDVVNFFDLNEEPEIERSFEKDDKKINMYKISRIAGTVIDKDKNKSSVILLTPDGVVTVKVWKNQYAIWDRQIARKNPDGTKTVVEKSFFQRGNKLIITGIRRDDNFIPKKYKNTEWPLFEKIVDLSDNGFILESQTERAEVD